MFSRWTFWSVLGSLVLAGAAIGFVGSHPRSVPLVLAPGVPAARLQQRATRSFRTEVFTKLVSIPAGAGLALKTPTALRVDEEANLYVLDSADRCVRKYSRAGEPLVAFGAEELQNPTDLAVASDGGVWVVDPNPRKLVVFDRRGIITRRMALDRLVWRFVLDERGGFVATLPTGTPTIFQHYSATTAPGQPFGTLFTSELQTALALDGWMVSTGLGGFVYIFAHEGLLAAYSPEGHLRFLRATIEAPALPKIHIDAAERQTVGPDVPRASMSGSVSGGDLYILGLAAGRRRVVDVYDVENGSYSHSFDPPDPETRSVVVTLDRVYSASRSGVTVWRRATGSIASTPPAAVAASLSMKGDDL